MLAVFRDVTLTQLTAACLYEMSKLMTENAVERVNFMICNLFNSLISAIFFSLLQYLFCLR